MHCCAHRRTSMKKGTKHSSSHFIIETLFWCCFRFYLIFIVKINKLARHVHRELRICIMMKLCDAFICVETERRKKCCSADEISIDLCNWNINKQILFTPFPFRSESLNFSNKLNQFLCFFPSVLGWKWIGSFFVVHVVTMCVCGLEK